MRTPTSMEPSYLELFSSFKQDWILFEDDDVIVVNKPVSLPSQASQEDSNDDVVSRLCKFISVRDQKPKSEIYLGVHQRLDQDTSGVMLLSKSKEANPSLASQFESRHVEKYYLAAVENWLSTEKKQTFENKLLKSKGKVQVLPKGHKLGKLAITHAKCMDSRQRRAILQLNIETGRTHQIRAQLANQNHAVVGDTLYDGTPFRRLLLHAKKLILNHPISGERLEVESSQPPEFESWLEQKDENPFSSKDHLRTLIFAAKERRYGIAQRWNHPFHATNCFRLFHGNRDGIDGLFLDVYKDYLVVRLHFELSEENQNNLYQVLDELPFKGVYLKKHVKQANVLNQKHPTLSSMASLPPNNGDLILGRPAPDIYSVSENGISFQVDFNQGLTTGVYLDQRNNRKRILESSANKQVLNLFAHQCAFSIAAAHGKAEKIVSVDASKKALAIGKENFSNMDFPEDMLWFIHEDVFVYLNKAVRKEALFDLTIVDPPTYSKVKTTRWTSGHMWVELATQSFRVTRPGGALLLCTNDHRMSFGKFRSLVQRAADQAKRSIDKLRNITPPSDFSPLISSHPHLKTLWVELSE